MPALHVLATVALVLIAIASLPMTGWLMVSEPGLAIAPLAVGFASLELLLRWIGRSLAWGLPHPASGDVPTSAELRWHFR
jgi:hypothetical protein